METGNYAIIRVDTKDKTDMNKHFRHFHFAGIGGVGMAGVAYILKKSGHQVSGCDLSSTPRTKWLEENGIHVDIGHSPSHITDDLDVCVFTPAVPKNSDEYLAAKNAGCSVKFRGEALAEIFNATEGIAVCGTHGKTTTSTFTAKLLIALGESPSWCIGGETDSFPVAGVGTGPMVIEADESDGTLSLYKAKTLVVTSLDYDHPDHFKTYEDYLNCYDKAIAAADNVIKTSDLPTDDWPEIRALVLGEHNVRNARTAVEVALQRGYSREKILSALPEALSALPDRRFEKIWPTGTSHANGTDACPTVISDYAHHPVEINCALSMARALNPERLRVIFQPHRHSRTKTLLEEFPKALSIADEVVLIPVYSAFEKPISGGDIADLYKSFRDYLMASGENCRLILSRNAREAWKHIYLTAKEGDAIILLGAGDIISLIPDVLDDMPRWPKCKNPAESQPIELSRFSFFGTGGISYGRILNSIPNGNKNHTIVGSGSNTWFSDCATDADIVMAPKESNASRSGASLIPSHPELSFMSGIPGTIGGWAKMNAGAFGKSFGSYIDHVMANGKKIPADMCGFGYRTSAIEGLISHVELKTSSVPSDQSPDEYLARRKKFPPRTCGSVFKNPSCSLPAGKLIEEAGCKAMRVGGAQVWEEHANVIKAEKGCTSSDILALARLVAARVRERFGISLVPEIKGLEV